MAPNRYVVLSLDAGDDEDMEEDDIVEVGEDEEYQTMSAEFECRARSQVSRFD